jgi:hypothetical protein
VVQTIVVVTGAPVDVVDVVIDWITLVVDMVGTIVVVTGIPVVVDLVASRLMIPPLG